MGRKIPGKKHRGIKDPEEQRKRKYDRIKHKINQPPKNADEQEIPAKLKKLMDNNFDIDTEEQEEACEDTGMQTVRKQKNGQQKPFKQIHDFKRKPGESDHSFLKRINEIQQDALEEASYKEKFDADMYRHPVTGKVEFKNRKLKKVDQQFLKIAIKSHAEKRKKKKERKMRKKLKKAEKLQSKKDDFANFQDKVQFGEVVHQPPQLMAKLKNSSGSKNVNKPGTSQLLQHLCNKGQTSSSVPSMKTQENNRGKRKNLPFATRRMLEAARDTALAAYKLARQKSKNS